jgi:hypothetical protein
VPFAGDERPVQASRVGAAEVHRRKPRGALFGPAQPCDLPDPGTSSAGDPLACSLHHPADGIKDVNACDWCDGGGAVWRGWKNLALRSG